MGQPQYAFYFKSTFYIMMNVNSDIRQSKCLQVLSSLFEQRPEATTGSKTAYTKSTTKCVTKSITKSTTKSSTKSTKWIKEVSSKLFVQSILILGCNAACTLVDSFQKLFILFFSCSNSIQLTLMQTLSAVIKQTFKTYNKQELHVQHIAENLEADYNVQLKFLKLIGGGIYESF